MTQIQQRYFLPSFLLIFQSLIAQPISSFSLDSFNLVKYPSFNTDFALLGDAHIDNKGNFVNLTPNSSLSSSNGTSGQIVYMKPFKFVDLNTSKPVSFSTEFSFNMSFGNGDGLVFVIFPSDEGFAKVFDKGYFGLSSDVDLKYIAVEFDTRKDDNLGDANDNHVGIDLSSFISDDIFNVSSIGLILNGGEQLVSWIDYDGTAKKLEIRLAEAGSARPKDPLMSYPVDLSKMWDGREVLAGISSSGGNSSQISSLFSWSFDIRTINSSLHSEPLNSEMKVDQGDPIVRRKKSCFLNVLGGVIFATGCGTIVAFFGLFLWVLFFGRHSNVVPDMPMNPIDFKYEKVDVTVDDNVVVDDSTRLSTS